MFKGAMDKTAVKTLMDELKAGFQVMYGDRLKGVYLYGSYARGEADPESDLDVLVVLDGYGRYADEIGRTSRLISSVSIAHGVSVSRIFVPQEEWLHHETPFLQNVHEEAVPA